MKVKIFLIAILITSLSLFAAGCKKAAPPPAQPVKADNTATQPAGVAEADQSHVSYPYNFTLTDQDGKSVTLADYAGKIIVLEWLNPDCPFVQRHYAAGTMIKLADKYRDQGVVWLAVNSTKTYDASKNKAFHDEHALPYPVLDDHLGQVGRIFGAKTTPHMFILDKTGQIAYQGAIDDDPGGDKGVRATNYVQKTIDELLAGQKVSTPQVASYGCSVKYAD